MAPSSYYHYYFTALCTFLSQHLTFTLRLRGFGEYVIKTYNGQLQKEIKRLKHIAVARLQASQGRGSLVACRCSTSWGPKIRITHEDNLALKRKSEDLGFTLQWIIHGHCFGL